MRLTKGAALQVCEDLWSWLAVNPEKKKEDYPGWERNGGGLPGMPYDCPCCAYATQIAGRTKEEVESEGIAEDECERCPLIEFWPGRCFVGDTLFVMWDSADPKGRLGKLVRTGYATMIATAAKQERKRLEQKAKRRKRREA